MQLGRTAPLILVTAALSACGESGDGEAPPETTAASPRPAQTTVEDQTDIRRTLERLATEAEPDLCTEALTERWVEDSFPPAAEESR